MNNNHIFLGFIFLLLVSCSTQRKIGSSQEQVTSEIVDLEMFCDTINGFKSLYISNIETNLTIGEDNYDAHCSMYYVPDSILFVSAVNSGFEIVRIAMMPDSTVYINRIDKLVMVLREENSGNKPPINFFDLEYMMNKIKLCGGKQDIKPVDNYYVIDRSLKDIGKKIYFSSTDMKVQKFEFFNKKSGEYIVGECLPTGGFTIYSNYLVEDLTIKANGGILKYNENHDINMGFNKRKYEIVNL